LNKQLEDDLSLINNEKLILQTQYDKDMTQLESDLERYKNQVSL